MQCKPFQINMPRWNNMLHKFAIKKLQWQTEKKTNSILWNISFYLLWCVFFIVLNECQLFAIDQTIQSMSQMMKSPNKNQKQITKPHQYYRCQILCLHHRYTITHKKPFMRPAHDFSLWLSNGPRIYRVLLNWLFVIRWDWTKKNCPFFLLALIFEK